MDQEEENKTTIQARLKVLNKSLVSEENSVQYYQTLLKNTAPDSDEKIGERRMYEDLQAEEKKACASHSVHDPALGGSTQR